MSTTPSDNGAGFLPCRPFWRDGHLPLSSTARRAGSTEIGGISRPGWHSPDGCRRGESPRCDVVVVSCWRPALALSSWRRSLRGGEQAGNRAGVPGGRTTLRTATKPMTHAIIQAPRGPHRGPTGGKATRYAGKGESLNRQHTRELSHRCGASHCLPLSGLLPGSYRSWLVSLYSLIRNAPSRSSMARASTSRSSCSHSQDLLPPSRSQLISAYGCESVGDNVVHILLDRLWFEPGPSFRVVRR